MKQQTTKEKKYHKPNCDFFRNENDCNCGNPLLESSPAGWRKRLRQLPVLYKASPKDIEIIEYFIAETLSERDAELVERLQGMMKPFDFADVNTHANAGYNVALDAALQIIKGTRGV